MFFFISCFVLCAFVHASTTFTTQVMEVLPTDNALQQSTAEVDPIFPGWSETVYEELKETSVWAKLAYCASKRKTTFAVGPLKDSCPKMKFCRDDEETEIVKLFKPKLAKGQYSGYYYVAAKHSEKKIILSFRGTDSLGDWVTNAAYQGHPYQPVLSQNIRLAFLNNSISFNSTSNLNIFENTMVYKGIYESYSKIASEAEEDVRQYVEDGYKLYITGHSLGGGYAYLSAVDFVLAGYKPTVISYSSLRIGNIEWNDMVDKLFNTKQNEKIVALGGDLPSPSLTRVVQARDLVPQLPKFLDSEGTTGYSHSGLLFELNKIPLPHEKADVTFRGATDGKKIKETEPLDKTSNDVFYIQGPKWYPHSFLFDVISSPCDDSFYDKVNYPAQELLDNVLQELGSFLKGIYNI